MDTSTIQIIAGIAAVIVVALIVWRRKNKTTT